TFEFARQRSIRWSMTGWMWAGTMPTAFAGALLASVVAPAVIEAAVGILAATSGLHALLGRQRADPEQGSVPSSTVLLAAGAFTGFSSSLTGTGGPLVLIPILV